MNTLDQIATKIIHEQELIIGPVAWSQARKVVGINFTDEKSGNVTIEKANGKLVIDGLVSQFEHLFGLASREVCRDAVASLIADMEPSDIPSSLR